MKVKRDSLTVFGGTAGAVFVAAAVARVVCPGGCQTCETCISSIAPMGAGFLTVGGVLTATTLSKRKRRRATDDEDATGAPDA